MRKLEPPSKLCQSLWLVNPLCNATRLLLQPYQSTHIPYVYRANLIDCTIVRVASQAASRALECQSGYGFGRRHSCSSSCSCGPARCSLVFELVRTMVWSIGVTSYVQDVGRLTDKVVRTTSSSYVRGSRAASFSTVRLVARASSCPSHRASYRTSELHAKPRVALSHCSSACGQHLAP